MRTANSILLALLLSAICARAANTNSSGGITILSPAQAQSLPAAPYDWTLKRQLESLILPRVNFHDSDLIGALQYLREKVRIQSSGAINLHFTVILPRDFKPLHELSLDLHSIPFIQALGYLAELGGIEFSPESNSVFVRIESPITPLPQDARSIASHRPRAAFSTNPLDHPTYDAKPNPNGKNLHLSMSGAVEPQLSGYIPHRSMGAWPVALDPYEKLDVQTDMPSKTPSAPPQDSGTAILH